VLYLRDNLNLISGWRKRENTKRHFESDAGQTITYRTNQQNEELVTKL